MKKRATRVNNSNLILKIKIRKNAIKDLDEVKVLDCYHGDGVLWGHIDKNQKIKNILGIEKKKSRSKYKVIQGDNLKVIDTIDVNEFNVIDFDAYTNPIDLMNKIFPRLTHDTVIIYTFCWFPVSGIPANLSLFKEIQKKAKTITNKEFEKCWKNYLNKNGINEYYEANIRSGGIKKKYGYFVYKP